MYSITITTTITSTIAVTITITMTMTITMILSLSLSLYYTITTTITNTGQRRHVMGAPHPASGLYGIGCGMVWYGSLLSNLVWTGIVYYQITIVHSI